MPHWTMWESWIVVDNAPDIGHQALLGAFQAHNPKQVVFSPKFMQGGSVCIELSSSEDAKNAVNGT